MIKLDTRNVKPKIYNIAVLTVILAAVVAILSIAGGEKKYLYILSVFTAYYLMVVVLLVRAFFRQIEYNLYSYNTIFYSGFALFTFSVFLQHAFLLYRFWLYPPDVDYAPTIISTLANSAKTYMFFTSPFVLVFAVALFISNVSLIRHEGKRFVNLLGILLSFLMVGGLVFLYLVDYYAMGSMEEVRRHDLITTTFSAIYLYCECMLIVAVIAGALASRYEPEKDKDFLIILGCGIRKDGTPTPLLKGRVDRALAFYRKQKEETGKELIFVPSGGQGPNEVISESLSMKNYLMEQGIPESQIIMEDKSTSTFENMKFSKEKIWEVNPKGKVAFATTNYHVFRGGLYGRRVKMKAQGMGAPTKWYFWPNASVREFVGLLTEHRLKQAIIFISLLVIYATLVYLNYR